jgi:hypothetical protein
VKAAISALDKWVRKGKAPKSGAAARGELGPPASIVTDANGNGVGGVRTPQVDVPIATFTGIQHRSDHLPALRHDDRLHRRATRGALLEPQGLRLEVQEGGEAFAESGLDPRARREAHERWAVSSTIGG